MGSKARKIELKNHLLRGCSDKHAFWTFDEHVVTNIYGLIEIIGTMNDYTFRVHVNPEKNKNDFADWLRDVFRDETLAFRLEGVTNKDEYLAIIVERAEEIKQWI